MKRIGIILALVAAGAVSHADEGMWTYNNFPAGQGEAEVRLRAGPSSGSSTRSCRRCASPGLLGQLRLAERPGDDQSPLRALAASSSSRRRRRTIWRRASTRRTRPTRCSARRWRSTSSSRSPTSPPRSTRRPRACSGKPYNDAQKAESPSIEKDCASGATSVRCDVVTLYHGGRTTSTSTAATRTCAWCSRPSTPIAFFGGDPDNFMFPRYDLDVSFVRVYEDGKPAKTPDYFKLVAGTARRTAI